MAYARCRPALRKSIDKYDALANCVSKLPVRLPCAPRSKVWLYPAVPDQSGERMSCLPAQSTTCFPATTGPTAQPVTGGPNTDVRFWNVNLSYLLLLY